MFQLLTGKLPFPAEDHAEDRKEVARRLLDQQRSAENLSGELERVVSPAIARVIAQCLAFDPDDRPQSAEQVARRFRRDLRAVPRFQRWVRSHRLAVASASLVLVLAAAAFGSYLATRPPVHVLQYELGLAHMEAGDFAAASQCFEQALDARSDFVQALILRGWADLKASQREGIDDAERLRRRRSALLSFDASWTQTKSAESAASLACCYEQMKNPDAAKSYLSSAVDLGLATPAVLNNLGYYLLITRDESITKDKYVEAVARLADAVRLDPKLQVAHNNLALARRKLAEAELTQAHREGALGHKEAAAGCVDRAAETLQAAIVHIEAARQSGSPSADLELAAACIYARASSSFLGQQGEAADAFEQELLEKAWKSCQAAVKLHLSPGRLDEVAMLAPKLGQDPRFQKLRKASPASVAAAPAKRLADVYPDILSSLLGINR